MIPCFHFKSLILSSIRSSSFQTQTAWIQYELWYDFLVEFGSRWGLQSCQYDTQSAGPEELATPPGNFPAYELSTVMAAQSVPWPFTCRSVMTFWSWSELKFLEKSGAALLKIECLTTPYMGCLNKPTPQKVLTRTLECFINTPHTYH